MMRRSLSCGLVAFLCAIPGAVKAQSDRESIAVEVVDQSRDSMGQRLVFQIKETFRKSASFRIADTQESRWRIIVSTMPRFDDSASTATMYAVIWTVANPKKAGGETWFYIDNTIGYAGTDVVARSAEGIVARTDGLISKLRKAARK